MKFSNNLKINKVIASNKSQRGGGDTWTIYLMKLVLLNDTCSQFQRVHNVSPQDPASHTSAVSMAMGVDTDTSRCSLSARTVVFYVKHTHKH